MSKPATSAKDWSDVVKGAKRELLLRAARDEFAEQGLEGATMRGIAVRVRRVPTPQAAGWSR